MAKFSRLLVIVFLLGLLSFVLVPVEFIHSLYDHTDTTDSFENNQAAAFDTNHNHCIILKIEFREFLITSKAIISQAELKKGYLNNCYQSPFLSYNYSFKEQRGPPA